jgi:hypothetical protein
MKSHSYIWFYLITLSNVRLFSTIKFTFNLFVFDSLSDGVSYWIATSCGRPRVKLIGLVGLGTDTANHPKHKTAYKHSEH